MSGIERKSKMEWWKMNELCLLIIYFDCGCWFFSLVAIFILSVVIDCVCMMAALPPVYWYINKWFGMFQCWGLFSKDIVFDHHYCKSDDPQPPCNCTLWKSCLYGVVIDYVCMIRPLPPGTVNKWRSRKCLNIYTPTYPVSTLRPSKESYVPCCSKIRDTVFSII